MGKRNYGNGIIDLRYRTDGSRTDYRSGLPFRVYCHYRDQQYSRCFATYREADDWKRDQDEQDRNRDNIGYIERKETERLRNVSVSAVIHRALKRIGEGMGDAFTLVRFAQSRLGGMSLFDVNGRTDLFIKYFKERSGASYKREGWSEAKQVKVTTVAKERNLIQAAFQLAIDENWFDVCRLLKNPARGIKLQGSMHKRNRILLEGEEERLIMAFEDCHGLNKYYLPLAMYLAMETGMRQQEIVNLRWSEIDFERRRITIRKSKTDKKLSEKGIKPGRVIVLPCDAMLVLKDLWHHLNDEGSLPAPARNNITPLSIKRPIDFPDSQIFLNRYGKPMTADALGDAFGDAVKRAALKPDHNGEIFTFHDTRRVANTMFEKAGLDLEERSIMRNGHTLDPMDDTYLYIENKLRTIQDKLDKHVLKLNVLDDQGQKKLDEDGNPIQYGVTLLEFARQIAKRSVTNLDVFNRHVSLLHLTRWTVTGVRVLLAQGENERDETLANEKALVVKYKDSTGKALAKFELVGYLLLGEAAKIAKCNPGKLASLNSQYGGMLSANGYLFFSEARIERAIKKHTQEFTGNELVSSLQSDPHLIGTVLEMVRDGERIPVVQIDYVDWPAFVARTARKSDDEKKQREKRIAQWEKFRAEVHKSSQEISQNSRGRRLIRTT